MMKTKALILALIVALCFASAASRVAATASRSLQQFEDAPPAGSVDDGANATAPVPVTADATAADEEEPAGDEVEAAPAPAPEEEAEDATAAAEDATEAPSTETYNQGSDECIYSDHPATLVETAASAPERFSTLVAALNASDLLGAFDDLSQKVTVFAPTNDAFDKLFTEFNVTAEEVLGNTDFLTKVLTHHVAGDVLPFGNLVDGLEIPTLEGSSLGVSAVPVENTVYSFGFPVGVATSNAVTILGGATNATIVQGNLWTCNGVIQIIDSVLVPQSAVTSSE